MQASDADVALNSQIYYSLVEWSLDFMVDPISGAIRNLRSLESGTYELTFLAEDRASRLFRKKARPDDENDLFNYNKAKAVLFFILTSFFTLNELIIVKYPLHHHPMFQTNLKQFLSLYQEFYDSAGKSFIKHMHSL